MKTQQQATPRFCQATRTALATVSVESDDPSSPFLVCEEVAYRLDHLALRPLEWFNLAAIHGPLQGLLHDDLYEEDGKACQPAIEVTESEKYPCPTLEECSFDIERLIDFALTRWYLDETVVQRFASHAGDLLRSIESRYECVNNEHQRARLAEIASEVLRERAADWFRAVLATATPLERIGLLCHAPRCLPFDEGRQAAMQALGLVPSKEVAMSCLVLAAFPGPATLDWIEENICEPVTHRWGDLAAIAGLDWDRAARWLEGGRYLSLVALDAMIIFAGPRPNHSSLVNRMSPKLRTTASASEIALAISRYAERDTAPRVEEVSATILKRLPAILARSTSD